MNTLRALWASVEGDPVLMRRLHGWLTVTWFVAAFPIMYFWSENITFLVFVSVYAVVTGHWSSFQAARVEVKQDQEMSADGQGSGAQPAEGEDRR